MSSGQVLLEFLMDIENTFPLFHLSQFFNFYKQCWPYIGYHLECFCGFFFIYLSTLTCQIIVQDHLIVQVADFSEINKRVGLNKAMQVEFFLIYIGENRVLQDKSPKLINVQVLLRLCRCLFPRKTIRFAARLFGRSEYLCIYLTKVETLKPTITVFV